MALLVQFDLTGLLVDAEVPFLGNDAFFFLDVLLEARNQLVDLLIELELSSAWPEMISGVRASSIRMESTSSMTAKLSSRWFFSWRLNAMLSRR